MNKNYTLSTFFCTKTKKIDEISKKQVKTPINLFLPFFSNETLHRDGENIHFAPISFIRNFQKEIHSMPIAGMILNISGAFPSLKN